MSSMLRVLETLTEDAKVGDSNPKAELLNICEDFVERYVGFPVDIEMSQFTNFSVRIPFDRSKVEEDSVLSLSLRADLEEKHEEITEAAYSIYGNVVYSLNPFTVAFLHEVGHLNTIADFAYELIETDLANLRNSGGGAMEYKLLPHEKAADEWCWNYFVPNHTDEVEELDSRIEELLDEIYSGLDPWFGW